MEAARTNQISVRNNLTEDGSSVCVRFLNRGSLQPVVSLRMKTIDYLQSHLLRLIDLDTTSLGFPGAQRGSPALR